MRSSLRTFVSFVVLSAAGACVWLFIDGPNGWRGIDARWQEVRSKEVRNADLRKEIVDLREKNRKLRESQDEIDQLIREQLHKAKPGERLFKLPDSQPVPAPLPHTPNNPDTSR